MTIAQYHSTGQAYKLSKTVLREIEDSAPKHTIFILASAVGALEQICLQENLNERSVAEKRRRK